MQDSKKRIISLSTNEKDKNIEKYKKAKNEPAIKYKDDDFTYIFVINKAKYLEFLNEIKDDILELVGYQQDLQAQGFETSFYGNNDMYVSEKEKAERIQELIISLIENIELLPEESFAKDVVIAKAKEINNSFSNQTHLIGGYSSSFKDLLECGNFYELLEKKGIISPVIEHMPIIIDREKEKDFQYCTNKTLKKLLAIDLQQIFGPSLYSLLEDEENETILHNEVSNIFDYFKRDDVFKYSCYEQSRTFFEFNELMNIFLINSEYGHTFLQDSTNIFFYQMLNDENFKTKIIEAISLNYLDGKDALSFGDIIDIMRNLKEEKNLPYYDIIEQFIILDEKGRLVGDFDDNLFIEINRVLKDFSTKMKSELDNFSKEEFDFDIIEDSLTTYKGLFYLDNIKTKNFGQKPFYKDFSSSLNNLMNINSILLNTSNAFFVNENVSQIILKNLKKEALCLTGKEIKELIAAGNYFRDSSEDFDSDDKNSIIEENYRTFFKDESYYSFDDFKAFLCESLKRNKITNASEFNGYSKAFIEKYFEIHSFEDNDYEKQLIESMKEVFIISGFDMPDEEELKAFLKDFFNKKTNACFIKMQEINDEIQNLIKNNEISKHLLENLYKLGITVNLKNKSSCITDEELDLIEDKIKQIEKDFTINLKNIFIENLSLEEVLKNESLLKEVKKILNIEIENVNDLVSIFSEVNSDCFHEDRQLVMNKKESNVIEAINCILSHSNLSDEEISLIRKSLREDIITLEDSCMKQIRDIPKDLKMENRFSFEVPNESILKSIKEGKFEKLFEILDEKVKTLKETTSQEELTIPLTFNKIYLDKLNEFSKLLGNFSGKDSLISSTLEDNYDLSEKLMRLAIIQRDKANLELNHRDTFSEQKAHVLSPEVIFAIKPFKEKFIETYKKIVPEGSNVNYNSFSNFKNLYDNLIKNHFEEYKQFINSLPKDLEIKDDDKILVFSFIKNENNIFNFPSDMGSIVIPGGKGEDSFIKQLDEITKLVNSRLKNSQNILASFESLVIKTNETSKELDKERERIINEIINDLKTNITYFNYDEENIRRDLRERILSFVKINEEKLIESFERQVFTDKLNKFSEDFYKIFEVDTKTFIKINEIMNTLESPEIVKFLEENRNFLNKKNGETTFKEDLLSQIKESAKISRDDLFKILEDFGIKKFLETNEAFESAKGDYFSVKDVRKIIKEELSNNQDFKNFVNSQEDSFKDILEKTLEGEASINSKDLKELFENTYIKYFRDFATRPNFEEIFINNGFDSMLQELQDFIKLKESLSSIEETYGNLSIAKAFDAKHSDIQTSRDGVFLSTAKSFEERVPGSHSKENSEDVFFGFNGKFINLEKEKEDGIIRIIHNEWYPDVAKYFKHKEIIEVLKNNPQFDSFFETTLDENFNEIKKPIKYLFYSKTNEKNKIVEVGLVLINQNGDKAYMTPEVIESFTGIFIKNPDNTLRTEMIDGKKEPIRFVDEKKVKEGLKIALEKEAKKFDSYLDDNFWAKTLFKDAKATSKKSDEIGTSQKDMQREATEADNTPEQFGKDTLDDSELERIIEELE